MRELLRVSEAARLLSLPRSTAYRLVADGSLPSIHLGARLVRVPADALDAFIAARTEPARERPSDVARGDDGDGSDR